MRVARLGAFMVGLALVLAACGRTPATSTATETPAPTASPSPGAEPTPLAITGPTLHVGEVGLAYVPVTYQATGGNPPYMVWTVSDGALPGGLSLSLDGVISGTPTASGTFNFTVEINDSSLGTANLNGSITIAPRLTVGLVHQNPLLGRLGEVASGPYASVSGGVSPYTTTMLSGRVPAGTHFAGLELSGSYSMIGTYDFAVTVTDSLGAAVGVAPQFIVYSKLAFPDWNCSGIPAAACPKTASVYPFDQMLLSYQDASCVGTNATGCIVELTYTGGTPGISPTVHYDLRGLDPYPAHPGPLLGMTAEASGGVVRITIPAGAIPPGANPSGFYGVLLVTLDDVPNCQGPADDSFCQTRDAWIRIRIAG